MHQPATLAGSPHARAGQMLAHRAAAHRAAYSEPRPLSFATTEAGEGRFDSCPAHDVTHVTKLPVDRVTTPRVS